jgi:hypothetical protein
MDDPFSEMPGMPRPTRRRFQPGLVQEALHALRETLRPVLPAVQRATRQARKAAKEGVGRAQRFGQDLWRRGRRNPRTIGAAVGAVALTVLGAYALSAAGTGRSLCPPVRKGTTPKFQVLMDRVPQATRGSEIEIRYDVCGLASGSAYNGRVRLLQQQPQRTAGKKKSPKPAALVVNFKDRTDGPATRRQQELKLGSTKPGTYSLELTVTDSKGRDRRKTQKVVVKAR